MQATSRIAYKEFNRSGEKIDHHRRINACLEFHGPGTSSQIAARTGLTYHQVARRVCELVASGEVKDSGEKGLSPSGKPAIIWEKLK